MRKLPFAATDEATYSEAIVRELERLNGNVEKLVSILAPAPEASDEVELREPVAEQAPAKKATHRDAKRAAKEEA